MNLSLSRLSKRLSRPKLVVGSVPGHYVAPEGSVKGRIRVIQYDAKSHSDEVFTTALGVRVSVRAESDGNHGRRPVGIFVPQRLADLMRTIAHCARSTTIRTGENLDIIITTSKFPQRGLHLLAERPIEFRLVADETNEAA